MSEAHMWHRNEPDVCSEKLRALEQVCEVSVETDKIVGAESGTAPGVQDSWS